MPPELELGTLSEKNYGIIWEFFPNGGPPPLLGTPYSKQNLSFILHFRSLGVSANQFFDTFSSLANFSVVSGEEKVFLSHFLERDEVFFSKNHDWDCTIINH